MIPSNPTTPSPPGRALRRLLLLVAILALTSLLWPGRGPGGWQASAAKGGTVDVKSLNALTMPPSQAVGWLLADAGMASLLAGRETEFVSAVRLGQGESAPWRAAGCQHYNCVHITLFNRSQGGTIEAVLNMTRGEVVARWRDGAARPVPSAATGERAMAIAAASPEVVSVLGELEGEEMAMVPMSAWLEGSDCRQQWCVDLTFHAPDGSGRIFHVLVNMQREQVAGTFYSRARADRPYTPPASQVAAAQGPLFNNGCHEQYGWSVCWEMTANDGLNFYDATYAGNAIFSSAKLGQVEVWYPSWPGGYRDEVGFQASVPPKFGTIVTELENGFEVFQLFTEPFDWPNCICCYRYGQRMTFFSDGSFEPAFISHGPGCSDPSTYRAFWRIDLDLQGPESDQVWLWQDGRWTEAAREAEIALYQDDSPAGEKVATFDQALHYRWQPLRTDPLGADDGRLYALAFHQGEGDGPIVAGAANTFQPPAQWLDGEPLSGGNSVFWYVPELKTKKGGPWWCMPDPAPDFSPCLAAVLLKPGGDLAQSETELAAVTATATLETLATLAPKTTPLPTPSPRPIQGQSAEELVQNGGCGSCHALASLGQAGQVGPDLSTVGLAAESRVPGMPAADYLAQSILEPEAYIVPDCPQGACQRHVMPADYGRLLSREQVAVLVAFLLEQRPPATPTPQPSPTLVAVTATPTLPPSIGANLPAASSTPLAADAGAPDAGNRNWLALSLTLGLAFMLVLARAVSRR